MARKSTSAFKKKIKEMKQNSKGKAILRLIKWGIFFLFIMIFCFISSIVTKNRPLEKDNIKAPVIDNPTKKEDNETKNLNYYLTKLNNSNISYTYKIKINNESYTFKGTKKDTIEEGYKESSSGIIKYYILDDKTYQDVLGEHILISNLYENLEEEYLNFNKLINHLLTLSFTKTDTIFSALNNNMNYVINIENDEIKTIIITGDNLEYSLNYEV